MKTIEIRNIQNTCLNKDAYIKVVSKYSKTLKNNIIIVFDKRIKNYYAYWEYLPETKTHLIKISCFKHEINQWTDKSLVDKDAQKYRYISTIIHELRHAQQKEELGDKFLYKCPEDIKHNEYKDYFSESEVDAREYENSNISDAIELYNEVINNLQSA